MEKFDKTEESIIDSEEFKKLHPEFFESIGKEKNNGNGSITYENASLNVLLKFEDFSDKHFPLYLQPRLHQFFVNLGCKPEEYYLLTEFIIKNDNFEYNLMSENRKVFVIFRKKPQQELSGQYDFTLKLVELDSPPSSPASILTLLHEIGHLNDSKLEDEISTYVTHFINNKLMGNIYDERIENERKTINLRKERYAWSYALKKIKPFIPNLGITNDLLNKHIHDVSIGSYCKSIQ